MNYLESRLGSLAVQMDYTSNGPGSLMLFWIQETLAHLASIDYEHELSILLWMSR